MGILCLFFVFIETWGFGHILLPVLFEDGGSRGLQGIL